MGSGVYGCSLRVQAGFSAPFVTEPPKMTVKATRDFLKLKQTYLNNHLTSLVISGNEGRSVKFTLNIIT